jgi:hypothetical protein
VFLNKFVFQKFPVHISMDFMLVKKLRTLISESRNCRLIYAQHARAGQAAPLQLETAQLQQGCAVANIIIPIQLRGHHFYVYQSAIQDNNIQPLAFSDYMSRYKVSDEFTHYLSSVFLWVTLTELSRKRQTYCITLTYTLNYDYKLKQ